MLGFITFFILFTLKTIYFSYPNLLTKIIFKFFIIFLYSLGENKFLYSNKRLPFKMKSIDPVPKTSKHY